MKYARKKMNKQVTVVLDDCMQISLLRKMSDDVGKGVKFGLLTTFNRKNKYLHYIGLKKTPEGDIPVVEFLKPPQRLLCFCKQDCRTCKCTSKCTAAECKCVWEKSREKAIKFFTTQGYQIMTHFFSLSLSHQPYYFDTNPSITQRCT